MNEKRTAIYLRLSRDDRISSESESITSQRLFLYQYAAQHGLEIGYEFADDGISGVSMQREALQNLLRTIQDGRIGTVLVKDLSRLSRDYIKTGELLENWFPAHGVRLIAVNDGVDTGIRSASNDFFPIKAVMDDWYARDISRKVRAAIHARQIGGLCTAATLPFGFKRNGTAIETDEASAKIVRNIFDQYMQMHSCHAVAAALNRAGISPIRSGSGFWHDATVRRILTNPAYIGQLHLHKTEKLSYKSSKKRAVSEAEHIVYPVPPLVSEDLFSAVQSCILQNGHSRGKRDWLSGRVFCAVCGNLMHHSGSGSAARLICGGRKRRQGCNNPSLRRELLVSRIVCALLDDGVPEPEKHLPELIERIYISEHTVIVHVKYRHHGKMQPKSESRQLFQADM
ncbi:MAG: recombinase family protein [Oscillospiraceae bacterium]|nr:recombinase family protein [Oscillospiraceae bacterium]